ncbi:uncharacterized protein LOC143287470 [Babylonia areolata]|uniref:uncharacterized protein LOC143287470 n=1 Tax=Babylonia areolata TaxID=304850 RepID=UPI003FD3FF37
MDCKEKEERRKRNREAARKCREKKVQEAETLKQDKEELERDNCELVKQRNQLRERCFALEEELRRHKEEGCLISECSPSHGDLSNILDPSCPPSPSLIGPQSPGLSLVRLPLSGRSQRLTKLTLYP